MKENNTHKDFYLKQLEKELTPIREKNFFKANQFKILIDITKKLKNGLDAIIVIADIRSKRNFKLLKKTHKTIISFERKIGKMGTEEIESVLEKLEKIEELRKEIDELLPKQKEK